MRLTAALSIAFHSAIILFAWLGAPSFRPLITPEQLIEVELVAEAAQPEHKPKPVPAAKPPPPPPPPPKVSEPEAVPLPKLAVKPKPKPKPRPKVKPKPKPKPKQQVRRPRPKSKPKPPAKRLDFASVLKTVEKLHKAPPVKTKPAKIKPKEAKRKPAPDFQKQIAEALKRNLPRAPRFDAVLSASELDAIRRQIEGCWSLQAGARGADNMIVEIRMLMNPDGRVREARIIDTDRANRDPFYRSMAESALRAVTNPRCQPLRLPLEKYDAWRIMVLNFDPRGMF